MSEQSTRLFYIHDPMCSWCYGFRPTWLKIKQQLSTQIPVISLVGGLAADSNEPMPESLRSQIRGAWQRIQQQIPGTRFNFDFWTHNTPRRSTYPACRAVITARHMADRADDMTHAIQLAYYQQARNPSDLDTLIDAAQSIGLDGKTFSSLIQSEQIQHAFETELQQVQQMGVYSFPSLVLQQDGELHDVTYDYNDPKVVINQIESRIAHA